MDAKMKSRRANHSETVPRSRLGVNVYRIKTANVAYRLDVSERIFQPISVDVTYKQIHNRRIQVQLPDDLHF